MTTLDIGGDETPDISVERADDESGRITLEIRPGTGEVVRIGCGRFQDDAEALRDELKRALAEAETLVNRWEDRPEEYDGYVYGPDRGGYFVNLEGMARKGQPREGYPSQDIATYELAAAMAEGGVFPNVWYQNERGNTDSIGEEVRKYHDAGGDKLLPLPGVEYQAGEHVRIDGEGWPMVVERDYGRLGIMLYTSGDPTITEFVDGDERHRVTPEPEDDDDN